MAGYEQQEIAAKARLLFSHAKSIAETVGLQAAVATTGNVKIAKELKGVTSVSLEILDGISKVEDLGVDSSKWVNIHERTVGNISQILDIASSLPSVHLVPEQLVGAFPGLRRLVSALEYVRRKSLTVDKKERWRLLWLKKKHEKTVLSEAWKRLADAEQDLQDYKVMVQRAKRAAAAARDVLTRRVTCESKIPRCGGCMEQTVCTGAADCASSSCLDSIMFTSSSTGSAESYSDGFRDHEYQTEPSTPPCNLPSPLPNFIRKLPAPPDLDGLDSRTSSMDECSGDDSTDFDEHVLISSASTTCRCTPMGCTTGDKEPDESDFREFRQVTKEPSHAQTYLNEMDAQAAQYNGQSEMVIKDDSHQHSLEKYPPMFSPGTSIPSCRLAGDACAREQSNLMPRKSGDGGATPCLLTDFHYFDEETAVCQKRPEALPTNSLIPYLGSTTMDSVAPSPQTASREEGRVPTPALSSEGEVCISGSHRTFQEIASKPSSLAARVYKQNIPKEVPRPPRLNIESCAIEGESSIPASPPVGLVRSSLSPHASKIKRPGAHALSDHLTRESASPQVSRIKCPEQASPFSGDNGDSRVRMSPGKFSKGKIPTSPLSSKFQTGLPPVSPVGRGSTKSIGLACGNVHAEKSTSLSPQASRIRRASALSKQRLQQGSMVPISPSTQDSRACSLSPGSCKHGGSVPSSPCDSGPRATKLPTRGGKSEGGTPKTIGSIPKSRGTLQVQLPAARSSLRPQRAGNGCGGSVKRCLESSMVSAAAHAFSERGVSQALGRTPEKCPRPPDTQPKPSLSKPVPPSKPLPQRQQTIARQSVNTGSAFKRNSPRDPEVIGRVCDSTSTMNLQKDLVEEKPVHNKQQRCHPPFPYIPQLALESDLKSILMVYEDESGLPVDEPPSCAIISGPRGSGKSMLVTHFLNGEPAKKHFDRIFWLYVGDRSGASGETSILLNEFYNLVDTAFGESPSTALGPPHSVVSSGQESLVFKLSCLLKGKNVLLVLDDVVEHHVQLLGVFLKLEIAVLVTTCKSMPDWKVRRFHSLNVPPLGFLDAEKLFWKMSRHSSKVDNSISKEIIQTCAGHPLLTCVAGTLLALQVKGKQGGVLEGLCTVHGAVKGDATDVSGIFEACLDEILTHLDTVDKDMFLMMAVLPYGGYASKEMLQNLWALDSVEMVTKKMLQLHSCFLVIPEECSNPDSAWGLHNMHMTYVRDKVAYRKDLQVKMDYRQQRYLSSLANVRPWFPLKRFKLGRFWSRVGGVTVIERLLKCNMDELKKDYDLVHMLEVFLFDTGSYETAERLITLVMLFWSKTLKDDDVELAISTTNMGFVRETIGDIDGAEEMHRCALTAWASIFGNDDVRTSTAMGNLGSILVQQGGLDEAERLFRDSLSLQQAVCGLHQPNAIVTMGHLGKLLIDAERLEEAERLFLTSVSFVFDLLGGNHPCGTTALKNLGLVLDKRGKVVDAEQIYRSGLSLLVNTFGDMHPEVAMGMSDLGCFLEKRHRLEEAEKLHKIALAILKRVFGINHPEVAASMCNLGAVYARLHKFEDAEEMNRRALIVMEGLLGNDHPDVVALRECVSV